MGLSEEGMGKTNDRKRQTEGGGDSEGGRERSDTRKYNRIYNDCCEE